MQGRLIDRASGKTIENGLAEKTFRADPGGSGSVIVKFKIDAHALAEQGITDLVVFEKCLLKGATDERGESRMTQVASHEDINDEAQWVTIDTVNPPGTGDPFWMSAFAAMAAALATGTVLICRRCRKGLR